MKITVVMKGLNEASSVVFGSGPERQNRRAFLNSRCGSSIKIDAGYQRTHAPNGRLPCGVTFAGR